MTRKSETGEPSRYMTPAEVMHQLHISRTGINDMVARGDLAAVKLGPNPKSPLRITRASFAAYCARIEREGVERFSVAT